MPSLTRRGLIRSTAALAAVSALPMPAWARGQSLTHAKNGFGEVAGEDVELAIRNHHFSTGGRSGHAVAVKGTEAESTKVKDATMIVMDHLWIIEPKSVEKLVKNMERLW